MTQSPRYRKCIPALLRGLCGMPLALRLNEGLGVFGKGKQRPDVFYGLDSCRRPIRQVELVAVVQEQQAIVVKPRPFRIVGVIGIFSVVAVLQPCRAESLPGVDGKILFKYCDSSSMAGVRTFQEVHNVTERFGIGFKSGQFASQAMPELAGGSIPGVEFGYSAQMFKLAFGRLDGQAVREDDPKQSSRDCERTGDQRDVVVGHSRTRRLLFAAVGGVVGIGIGLLLGWAWLRLQLKTPNV